VPTFVFGRRFAVSGAQPVAALVDAARRGLSGA
jgi:predicted DsbA family dithiol-disulfide isomerase